MEEGVSSKFCGIAFISFKTEQEKDLVLKNH